MSRVKFLLDHTYLRLITHLTSITRIYVYMYIYILADAIVRHMITVTCMPDRMSNEKEKKRKREDKR